MKVFLLAAVVGLAAIPAMAEDVDSLVASLGSNPNAVNTDAINKLVDLGSQAVNPLCAAVRSDSLMVQASAKMALQRLVYEKHIPESDAALHCIQNSLPHFASSVNATQVKMIMQPMVESLRAATGPLSGLEDGLSSVSSPATPYLIPLLQDKNAWTRWNAIAALEYLAKNQKLTPSWKKMFLDILDEMGSNETAPQVRTKAAAVLRELQTT